MDTRNATSKRTFLRALLLFSATILLLSACEIPNYKGTLWYYMARTSDLGVLDTERRIYELRAPAPRSGSGAARTSFQVPVQGVYTLRRKGTTDFGYITIWEYEDQARTTLVSEAGGYVNPDSGTFQEARYSLFPSRYYEFQPSLTTSTTSSGRETVGGEFKYNAAHSFL